MANWTPKDFSQELSNENDPQTKKIFTEFAEQYFGWKLVGAEDSRRPSERDLVFAVTNHMDLWVEVEHKLENWRERGRTNRFSTLHIPFRKDKSKADVYSMFNYYYDTLAIGDMQMLKTANVVGVPCWVDGQRKDDLMFDCHQTAFRFYTKFNRSRWTEITMNGDVVDADTPSSYRYANQTPFLLGVSLNGKN